MSTLTLDIVTPAAQVVSQPVDMVVIPGTDGDFGVLAGHSPLISAIRPGVIKLYKGDHVTTRILVTGGFAEVTGERCTVLATEVYDFAKTSRKDLEERLKAMKTSHDKAKSPQEKEIYASSVSVAEEALGAFIRELDSH
jgi:F-type H+-transporting ATPase subunit epsilon